MLTYLSTRGEVIGLAICNSMIAQFIRKCAGLINAKIIKQRIDKPLPYEDEFDKAFRSIRLRTQCSPDAQDIQLRYSLC